MNTPEYVAVGEFYGDRCSARSRVPLMNHIDEGLEILRQMNVDEHVLAAWCLHPLVQGNSPIDVNWSTGYVLAREYRLFANFYLCRPETDHFTEDTVEMILEAVSTDCVNMLLVDKQQNQKDFRLYNSEHPRAKELEKYFNNWINGISKTLSNRQTGYLQNQCV